MPRPPENPSSQDKRHNGRDAESPEPSPSPFFDGKEPLEIVGSGVRVVHADPSMPSAKDEHLVARGGKRTTSVDWQPRRGELNQPRVGNPG